MNATISVFVICVEAIIYLLLYNLHDCTFKLRLHLHDWRTFSENNFLTNRTLINLQEAIIFVEKTCSKDVT